MRCNHERTVRTKTGGGAIKKAPKFRFGGWGGHSAKMYSQRLLKTIFKVYKNFAQKFKKFSKIFKIKIIEFKTI